MEHLRLYDYGASANCFKVRLLLAQLGVPYDRVAIDIFAGDTLTEDFRAKNPARTTPVLQIGDSTYLQESNAILFYLADGTELLPDDPLLRAQVVRWLIIEQTDVMPGIGGLRFRLQTKRWTVDHPDAIRRRELGLAALDMLEEHVGAHSFFVDERYSIADISLYAYTHVAPDAGFDLEAFPAVAAWLRRVEATPRFVNDLQPYPPNADRGAGTSLYD
jgi:glutathione S-transferase